MFIPPRYCNICSRPIIEDGNNAPSECIDCVDLKEKLVLYLKDPFTYDLLYGNGTSELETKGLTSKDIKGIFNYVEL